MQEAARRLLRRRTFRRVIDLKDLTPGELSALHIMCAALHT